MESNRPTGDDGSDEDGLASESGALSYDAVKARRLGRESRRRVAVIVLALGAAMAIVVFAIWFVDSGALELFVPEQK